MQTCTAHLLLKLALISPENRLSSISLFSLLFTLLSIRLKILCHIWFKQPQRVLSV
jgi:hypothetical protein